MSPSARPAVWTRATPPDYLAAGAAFVGIGGRLVDEALVAAGDRDAVQRAAEEALGIMRA